MRTKGLEIHEAVRLFIPPNVVDIERQSSDEEVGMRDGGVRTRGSAVQTRGGGVRTRCGGIRTRGRGVRTRGGHIYDDPHFPIDDASLDFPLSPLQHSATLSSLFLHHLTSYYLIHQFHPLMRG